MVKTKGPLMSAEASGTLAKQLTFLNTRRGSTIRRRVLPRDPATGGQLGHRWAFTFLTKNWAGIIPAHQATWLTHPAVPELSIYNAYVREQLHNWRGFLAPGREYPIARSGTLGTVWTGPNATLLGPDVQLELQLSPMNTNWGVIFFASLSTSFATAVENTIGMYLLRDTALHTWTWPPPNAGPWYFNARLFSIYGNLGAELGEFTLP